MSTRKARRGRGRDWLRVGALVVIVLLAVLIAWRLGYFDLKGSRLRDAVAHVRAARWAGPLFIAVYAAGAALGLPPTLLTLLGGAVFGLARGLLYNWIALLIGSAGGYWLARAIGGGVVHRLLRGRDELRSQLQDHHGFLAVLRMQVIPLIPFVVANYAAGSARVPFPSFLGATALGVVPPTAAYTYVAQQVVDGISGAQRHALVLASVVAALAVAVTYAPAAFRRLRRSSGS